MTDFTPNSQNLKIKKCTADREMVFEYWKWNDLESRLSKPLIVTDPTNYPFQSYVLVLSLNLTHFYNETLHWNVKIYTNQQYSQEWMQISIKKWTPEETSLIFVCECVYKHKWCNYVL